MKIISKILDFEIIWYIIAGMLGFIIYLLMQAISIDIDNNKDIHEITKVINKIASDTSEIKEMLSPPNTTIEFTE